MSKLSPKEFAAAIGKPIGTIKSHHSRGKIVKDTTGLIDTDNELNRRYIEEETQGKGLFSPVAPVADSIDSSGTPSPEKPLSQSAQVLKDLELRKKIAEADSIEAALDLKKIQLDKAAGNLLPVELVLKIMKINIQAIFKTFEGELENQASIYTEVFGGTREHLAKIIEQQRIVLAKTIEKSKEDSAAEIKSAIEEYQDTRNRGERK